MAHNRVISTQAMARSKKIDSQTTICKLLLPKKWVCLQQPVLCRPTKNVRHCFIKSCLTSSVHFPFGVRTIPNGSPIFCLSYKLCC